MNVMNNVHEIFMQQKAHLQPHRLSPAQIAADEAVAAKGVDLSDGDDDYFPEAA